MCVCVWPGPQQRPSHHNTRIFRYEHVNMYVCVCVCVLLCATTRTMMNILTYVVYIICLFVCMCVIHVCMYVYDV
jgi:hypothetical protein